MHAPDSHWLDLRPSICSEGQGCEQNLRWACFTRRAHGRVHAITTTLSCLVFLSSLRLCVSRCRSALHHRSRPSFLVYTIINFATRLRRTLPFILYPTIIFARRTTDGAGNRSLTIYIP